MARSILAVACLVAAAVALLAAPAPGPGPGDEQERLLARGKRFAERGEVDLLVAVTAVWKLKPDDLRMWEPAANLGRKLIEKADMKEDGRPQDGPCSGKDFATYLRRFKPTFSAIHDPYYRRDHTQTDPSTPRPNEAIQAPAVVDSGGITNCLVLARGRVETQRGIQHSLVFANGDVAARTIIKSAVIVSDGNVTVAEPHLGRSLIVARGNITAGWGASNLVLMAGGDVALGNKAARLGKDDCLIVENKPNTLGVVFFELATVGLEVAAAEKSIRVSAVAAGKSCGMAGMKVGDVILKVGDKAPTDAESLRRLLRDALAVGDAVVTLKRGETNETVKVSLPE